MTGKPLSVDTLPDNFVPRDAYVAEYWAQLRTNRRPMDLAQDESSNLDIHAGLDDAQDVPHVNDTRGRRTSCPQTPDCSGQLPGFPLNTRDRVALAGALLIAARLLHTLDPEGHY